MTDINPRNTRDLIKLLIDALKEECNWIDNPKHDELIAKATAYLTQYAPKGPTVEEILALSQEHGVSYTTFSGSVVYGKREGYDMRDDILSFAHDLLALWGK